MKSPSFTVVIPARYDSSRFPGKPLIDLAGKTMIERVYRQAEASLAERVVVATDDERIASEVSRFGGEMVMTDANHENGTDRIFEAAEKLDLKASETIVNVQGDEPLIPPEAINTVAAMISAQYQMATLCEALTDKADILDPNIVKVVFDTDGRALYFSRAPIPYPRDEMDTGDTLRGDGGWYRHLGIYAYTVDMLADYVRWQAAELEKTEKLEQLRVLANGASIAIAVSPVAIPPGIDVPEDVDRTLAALQ